MTEKEAFEIARRNGYEHEVMQAVLDGYTPEEALESYGCLTGITLEEYLVPELMTEEEIDVILYQDELVDSLDMEYVE